MCITFIFIKTKYGTVQCGQETRPDTNIYNMRYLKGVSAYYLPYLIYYNTPCITQLCELASTLSRICKRVCQHCAVNSE